MERNPGRSLNEVKEPYTQLDGVITLSTQLAEVFDELGLLVGTFSGTFDVRAKGWSRYLVNPLGRTFTRCDSGDSKPRIALRYLVRNEQTGRQLPTAISVVPTTVTQTYRYPVWLRARDYLIAADDSFIAPVQGVAVGVPNDTDTSVPLTISFSNNEDRQVLVFQATGANQIAVTGGGGTITVRIPSNIPDDVPVTWVFDVPFQSTGLEARRTNASGNPVSIEYDIATYSRRDVAFMFKESEHIELPGHALCTGGWDKPVECTCGINRHHVS